MAWYIKSALNGGFGGTKYCDWELTDAENEQDAESWAFEAACECYESYGGMHGLFNEDEARDEDPNLTDEDIEEMYNEDRESWLEYEAKWFDTDPKEEQE